MIWAIGPTEDLAACHGLRRAVFIEEQGISEAEEWDDLDREAVHLLARVDGAAMGTARLLRQGQVGRIGRICVLPPARGTGLGAALVRAGIAALEQDPECRVIRLGAQVHALGFYERLGFAVCGPIYDDAGIPHREMERPLSR